MASPVGVVMKQVPARTGSTDGAGFQDRSVSRRRCAIRSLTFFAHTGSSGHNWHSFAAQVGSTGSSLPVASARRACRIDATCHEQARRRPWEARARDSQYQAVVVVMQVIFRFNRPECGGLSLVNVVGGRDSAIRMRLSLRVSPSRRRPLSTPTMESSGDRHLCVGASFDKACWAEADGRVN